MNDVVKWSEAQNDITIRKRHCQEHKPVASKYQAFEPRQWIVMDILILVQSSGEVSYAGMFSTKGWYLEVGRVEKSMIDVS